MIGHLSSRLECVAGPAEPDQPDRPARQPRKARLGEEFTPKLHIQPERSLGLTARTPQSRWSALTCVPAPAPPTPAGVHGLHHPPGFAGLAEVGRSVWSIRLASEPSPAGPGPPARSLRACQPYPAGRPCGPDSSPPADGFGP